MVKLVMLAVAALALAGCGGTHVKSESATAFLHRVTVEFSRAQSGRLYDDLVPAQQAVVSRNAYVGCARNGFRLKSFKVLDSYDEAVQVLGRNMPSTAVSVQVSSDDGVTIATLHALRVAGRWRWLLPPRDLAAFRAGRCP
ncbi:MAG TPA: hypothetical protein VI408_01430 [Gaiellaceae bacterium]